VEAIQQILITLAAVAGSTALWNFLSERIKAKTEARKDDLRNDDGMQYRDDLKDRVRNLESLLAKSSDEKDELRDTVLELTKQVSELSVKVEFLEKENERLKNLR
jgi:predicted nuclease with TOPRIM domain